MKKYHCATHLALATFLLATAACSSATDSPPDSIQASAVSPASTELPPEDPPPIVGTYAPWEYFSYPHHVLNEEVTTTSDPCIKDPLLEPDDPNYVGYIDVPAYCVEIYGKANLVVGESTELQCWGYAQRNPMIGQPAWPVSANRPRTWSTQNATEVTVNTQTNFWKNTIQGVAPGATRILCSIDGKVGAIKVTVSAPAPTLTEVRVEGPTGGNAHGLSMPFTTKLTARAVYSNGTTEVVNNTAT